MKISYDQSIRFLKVKRALKKIVNICKKLVKVITVLPLIIESIQKIIRRGE